MTRTPHTAREEQDGRPRAVGPARDQVRGRLRNPARAASVLADELGPHRWAVALVAVPALVVTLAAVDTGWAAPAYAVLAVTGAALAVVDARTHRLPDVIVLPSYPLAALLLAAASAGTGDWGALGRAALGALALFSAYLALALAQPGGLGFGDVKLAGVLGGYLAWAGWPALVVGTLAAFVLGGLVSVVLLCARRATRSTRIPFGPFMVAGALVGLAAA